MKEKWLSRYLSYILRHNPRDVNAAVDSDGYLSISVDELARRISRKFRINITSKDIMYVVLSDEKGRYEIKGNRIRATYGHTLPHVRISGDEENIPEELYHGTCRDNLQSILKKGLLPRKRNMVHLSETPDLAFKVGLRHAKKPGRVIILSIDTRKLRKKSYKIYRVGKGIYVVKMVPPEAIKIYKG